MLTASIISGLGLGSMYGLIALGYHVTYVVSNTVNFSQGSAMMLGAVLGYTFAVTLGGPLQVLLARTRLGKALLAVVQNPDAARLMGIDVGRAVTVSFMISTALAALAGLLIAPLFSVHSDMGTLFGIKAFAVAILGGITSAWGVVLAGLLYGLIEALVTAYAGSTYTQIVAFTVVILALAAMPNGILGRAATNKV